MFSVTLCISMEQIIHVNHISFPCDKGRWILKTPQREGWKIERWAPHHTAWKASCVCAAEAFLSLSFALSTNWISSPLPYSFFNSLTCAFFPQRQQVLLLFFARLPHLIRGAFHYNIKRRARAAFFHQPPFVSRGGSLHLQTFLTSWTC